MTTNAATARTIAKLNPPPSGSVGSGIWICGSSCMNAIRSFACFAGRMPSSGTRCSEFDSVLGDSARDTLAADNETIDQRLRQFCCAHPRLDVGNLVRNAPELHDFVLQVGDRKTSARIPIAWLTDRTRLSRY